MAHVREDFDPAKFAPILTAALKLQHHKKTMVLHCRSHFDNRCNELIASMQRFAKVDFDAVWKEIWIDMDGNELSMREAWLVAQHYNQIVRFVPGDGRNGHSGLLFENLSHK